MNPWVSLQRVNYDAIFYLYHHLTSMAPLFRFSINLSFYSDTSRLPINAENRYHWDLRIWSREQYTTKYLLRLPIQVAAMHFKWTLSHHKPSFLHIFPWSQQILCSPISLLPKSLSRIQPTSLQLSRYKSITWKLWPEAKFNPLFWFDLARYVYSISWRISTKLRPLGILSWVLKIKYR